MKHLLRIRVFLRPYLWQIVATLLLLLQGDLLFVTLRGSHEKLTWPLMMVALFLLYRSSAKPEKLSVFATYVGLFYLTMYALVATSAFFSSTLIAAITLSLVLGLAIDKWPFGKKTEPRHSHFQRLSLVSASSIILLYLSVIYVYVPGRQVLTLCPRSSIGSRNYFSAFNSRSTPTNTLGLAGRARQSTWSCLCSPGFFCWDL